MRGQTADRQEIGEKDAGKLHEIVTDVPARPKRGDTIRVRLVCTAKATPKDDPLDNGIPCSYATDLFPERDLASAQKALGKHAVERHSEKRTVKIVTERREEVV